MKRIFYFIAAISLFSCGSKDKPTEKKLIVDSKAQFLNDHAVVLATTHREKDSILKAIKMLHKATEIQPDYFIAFSNKMAFQNQVGLRDEAFKTLQKMISLSPENPDLYMAEGYYYDEKGETENAIEKYQKAEELYISLLKKLEKGTENYDMNRMNRALNLKLLGENEKSNKVLDEIIQDTSNEIIKEEAMKYKKMTKEDIIKMEN
ncbi:tetratricopeptide repeat protein [Aureivirga sp. CE67]|uniref:tetratricopeptide repeat protein n=1 Tax=Aureivirga sp. CE67 TaxID=1788983 RepID=UPI0018C90A82|nr:hypothetical protein [Aureivirga sp. CE67]